MLAVSLFPVTACAAGSGGEGVQRLSVRVLGEVPHDPQAFTQGLLWHEGKLYESTGLHGRSTLRRIDPGDGRIEHSVELPEALFGEGLARVGDRLVQLTWRNGEARVYDLSTLELVERQRYSGEGWGLCFDGRELVMSNGSAQLVRRDPTSFAELERIEIRLDGRPVRGLNELECAEGWIYANVWQSDRIVRIDPASGEVMAVVDAAPLRRRLTTPLETDAVLNGIAYRPDTATFYLTGKLWPVLFEVVFVD
ncbi:MAG: glutaminyl-peptide cyclotransferase [Thermoanaerobaculia bacterium]|nr:glutaminyl-peptide cyclotransferase [Thermoanaerobaculia bacterium]